MSILNNALSGAVASQVALSAASQNIANLQTKGYTRQSAVLAAVAPATGTRGAGNGVQVTSLMRFSDNYKTQQLWSSNSELGAYSQNQTYLTQLEKVMGDDTASVSSGVDQFFTALNAVAADPSSAPLRQQVVTGASLMSQRFNSLNTVFNAQLQSIRQQRSSLVDSANSNITSIATLNAQIANANATGSNPSALIDKRDQAIDLSSLMALDVSDQPDGTRDVSLKSGQSLVLGGIAGKLSVGGGIDQTFTLDVAGSTFALEPTTAGGQLGGLSSYLQNTLQPLQQGVADMAQSIADKVNTQLGAGYTSTGAAGTPLFTYTPGSTSTMLQVASGFETTDLAFSSDPAAPGDTGNLQQLVAIQRQPITVTGLGSVTISDADTQLVGRLAVDSQQNNGALTTAQSLRDQATSDWQSTSGVNQDEEAVNLVEYQNMYQANMKVISVANALFDATLQMMG
jgi:flagellar hook-associated protein 1 FlgK